MPVVAPVVLTLQVERSFKRLPRNVGRSIVDVMILEKSLTRSSRFKTQSGEKHAGIAARCTRRAELIDVAAHREVCRVLQAHALRLRCHPAQHKSVACAGSTGADARRVGRVLQVANPQRPEAFVIKTEG